MVTIYSSAIAASLLEEIVSASKGETYIALFYRFIYLVRSINILYLALVYYISRIL